MNKTILYLALSSACTLTATSAVAALPANALLNFEPGVQTCAAFCSNSPNDPYYPPILVVSSGSYFGMDTNGNGSVAPAERTAISQNDGLFLGITQAASGSHGGDPDGTESAGIDAPWSFFGSTGMHFSTSPTDLLSATGNTATVDFSGWAVTWNAIPVIPMGAGAWQGNAEGVADITCAVDCAAGDTYTLDFSGTVPANDPSGFQFVKYNFHLVGTVALQAATNTAPVANDDLRTVDRNATGRPYIPSVIDILANDTDVDSNGDIDRSSVVIDPNGTDVTTGIVDVDSITGNVTYTPALDFLSPPTDSFTYTVTDFGGPEAPNNKLTSNVATVTITVQNAVPVAVDDSGSIDTSSDTSVAIDVTNNDTDSDGTINKASVNITVPATNGATSKDLVTGVVTYTPNAGFVGVDTFQYTVEDDDIAVSNTATVVVTVSSGTGVLPANAFLILDAGTGSPGEGTYFTMEVNPGQLTFVGITGFNHIKLGVTQLGSAAMPDIDEPWQFFGNLGVHQSTSPVTVLTDDSNGNVTLDFTGWDVSWNNIASIPMGNGDDNGIATMTCAVDCSINDTFSLIYRATVPPGDPSGFGGVDYILHMSGIVSDGAPTIGGGNTTAPYRVTDIEPIVAVDDSTSASPNPVPVGPGTTATNAGNTTGVNLTPEEIGVKDPSLNVNDGEQCIGGCADFIATAITTDFIDVVFKLNKPLPDGAVLRKLINGKWDGFSTSGGEQVGSANADASGNCQGPEGVYSTGLRAGASCIFLRIYDGGPNDADGAKNGTIVDPSGALLAGSSNVPPSSTSGCSISDTKVDFTERADWFIVAGFVVWLGLIGYRRNKAVN